MISLSNRNDSLHKNKITFPLIAPFIFGQKLRKGHSVHFYFISHPQFFGFPIVFHKDFSSQNPMFYWHKKLLIMS